jgi:hypothetical protein
MPTKHIYGLVDVSIGAIAGDGGMGTVLAAVGETVADSASITSEDNTITDFISEEADSPVESITSARGAIILAWSTYALDADTMIKFFGGTKVTGPPVKWQAPDIFPDIELSIKLTDKKGNFIEIPRGKFSNKFSFSLSKTKLGQTDVRVTILQPTKAGEKRMTITYA